MGRSLDIDQMIIDAEETMRSSQSAMNDAVNKKRKLENALPHAEAAKTNAETASTQIDQISKQDAMYRPSELCTWQGKNADQYLLDMSTIIQPATNDLFEGCKALVDEINAEIENQNNIYEQNSRAKSDAEEARKGWIYARSLLQNAEK